MLRTFLDHGFKKSESGFFKYDEWYGFKNEYVKRFAKDLGVDIQYVKYEDGENQFQGLKKGKVDLVITLALIETHNADDEYTTSIPYKTWKLPDFRVILRKIFKN